MFLPSRSCIVIVQCLGGVGEQTLAPVAHVPRVQKKFTGDFAVDRPRAGQGRAKPPRRRNAPREFEGDDYEQGSPERSTGNAPCNWHRGAVGDATHGLTP